MKLIYEHRCPEDCTWQGQVVAVRPTVLGDFYLEPTPRCVETTAELYLVHVER